MATTQLHKLSALVTPAGTIPALMSRSIDPGIVEYILKGDGKVSPQFYANMEQRPMFAASTPAVAAALTALGSSFYYFTSATTLYLAKLALGGTVAGSTNHAKLAGSKGCIIPRRISVQHGRPAMLDFDGYFLSSDGATAPWAYTGSVALPSMSVNAESFTLGLCTINGTTIAAMKELTIEFNYREIIHTSGGDLYPTFAAYESLSPTISFRTADPTFVNTTTVLGVAQGGTASKFHLQKLSPTGRVAAGTAEHIRFTMAAGFFKPGRVSENDEGESEIECTVTSLDDGTNAVLATNLATAIA